MFQGDTLEILLLPFLSRAMSTSTTSDQPTFVDNGSFECDSYTVIGTLVIEEETESLPFTS